MNVAINVIGVLAYTALFLWVKSSTRQGTFFSVRVEPNFANSDSGRAILRNFRRRVWLWALVTCVVFAASLGFRSPVASLIRWMGFALIIIGDFTVFAMASRETRGKAHPVREPPPRTAALFTAEEERSVGLALLDWLGILLPVIFPVVTAVLFVLNWQQIPLDKRQYLLLLGIATPLSIVSSFSYFALRFCARSRDWNPDPQASHKYRTMLGFATTLWMIFLSFVLCSVCVFAAVPLKEATQWLLVEVFLWVVLLGLPVLFFGFFGIVWWLKRNFSTESSDPMPDSCWKWGYFYLNSDDPALVVPSRSGIRFSYNYAGRPVWWFIAGPAIMSLIVLLLPHFLHLSLPTSEMGTRRAAPRTTQAGALSGQRGGIPSLAASPIKTKVSSKDSLTYVWIPPGTFEMGCSVDDSECDSTRYPHRSERPAHTVTITKGFWIGQTPVTQAAYTKMVGINPSHFKGDQLPVESVSWADAQAYCDRVDMRLPTEAEYEYAARGGNASARYPPADDIAWYSANSAETTHEVAQKQANGFGLYDVLGNVWEWVGDWYGPYDGASVSDPKGPSHATPTCLLKFFYCHQNRILRGGSWSIAPFFARASVRGGGNPDLRDPTHGFRCAGN